MRDFGKSKARTCSAPHFLFFNSYLGRGDFFPQQAEASEKSPFPKGGMNMNIGSCQSEKGRLSQGELVVAVDAKEGQITIPILGSVSDLLILKYW